MNALCIIPARGGSKRFPGKNLRTVVGKPLLTASSEAALLHVLDQLQTSEEFFPDLVVFLQCTSPVREPEDIDNAVKLLIESEADSLFSATESRAFIWRRDCGALSSVTYDFRARHREQDHPDDYRENGSIYVFRPSVLRTTGNRLGGRITMYPMDYWSSFQVDMPEDLELIEWILQRRNRATALNHLPLRADLVVLDFDGVMTDNRVLVLDDGREAVLCDRADGFGAQQLVAAGIPILVLSTEINPVVRARCGKLKIPCLQGVERKWPALQNYLREHGVVPANVVYLGNDVNDSECLEHVGCGVVVGDAHQAARGVAKIVLNNSGGHGAVRELVDLLLTRIEPASRP